MESTQTSVQNDTAHLERLREHRRETQQSVRRLQRSLSTTTTIGGVGAWPEGPTDADPAGLVERRQRALRTDQARLADIERGRCPPPGSGNATDIRLWEQRLGDHAARLAAQQAHHRRIQRLDAMDAREVPPVTPAPWTRRPSDAASAAEPPECTICLATDRSVTLTDCCHSTMCASCARRVETCPHCRAPIKQRYIDASETGYVNPSCQRHLLSKRPRLGSG